MKKTVLSLAFGMLMPFAANAAIIDNGTIQLGVDQFGQLNVPGGTPSPVSRTTAVGLRYMPTGNEATSHGCICEGWGVGIGETLVSGSANNDDGVFGLSLVDFTSTASTATSVVTLNGSDLKITHSFAPAAETSNLYTVNVKIENTGTTDIADLRYTRTFDWDVEPTAFREYVTHWGVATTPSVLLAVDNGFVASDPFASRSNICSPGGDFVNAGPCDNGSNFDFGFGALAAGATYEFDIFYGAALTEAQALAALGAVGAELYSLAKSANDMDGLGLNNSNTFIFAFKGVGGTVVVPPVDPAPVPLPAAGLLLLGGFGALGALRARRRAA